MFRTNPPGIDAFKDCLCLWRQRDARRRNSVPCLGHAGRLGRSVVLPPGGHIHDLNFDSGFRAGVHACGFEALGQPAVTHIAFADNTSFRIELRHAVGAVPDTILATDAGICRVKNDARHRIFLVRIYRASLQAVRIKAVVASHGKIVALRIGIRASFNFADASPPQVGRVVILLIAGDLAGSAANAFGHVEMKAVLLPCLERPGWHQRRAELWNLCTETHGIRERDLLDAKPGKCQAHKRVIVCGLCSVVKWQGQGQSLSSYHVE